jgi:hypothetical protein
MALPKYKSFLGIAKEASRAAGVAPTPVAATDFIPVKDITPFDNIKYLTDEGWRSSMVVNYGEVQGVEYSEFEFGGDVFADTIGYAAAGVLGDYAISGASAPYTHTMAVKNSTNGQATSYTLTDFNAVNARQFAGAQFGSLEFKFSADGLLEYTAMAQGYISATATTPTPSFSAIAPTPVWVGTTTIGGSLTAKLTEGSVNITRELTPIFSVSGSQNPYQIFQGPVEVEGSLKLIMEDDTDLDRYLNNTQPSLALDFSQGTGGSLTQLLLTMTKCAFVVAKVDRSNDYVELDVNFKAIANTTDVGASAGFSPIKITLKNAKSTTVYA